MFRHIVSALEGKQNCILIASGMPCTVGATCQAHSNPNDGLQYKVKFLF